MYVQALRRDLHALEADTRRFVAEVEETKTWSTVHLQQVEGQFRFLWGIYQAHSDVRALTLIIPSNALVMVDTFIHKRRQQICAQNLAFSVAEVLFIWYAAQLHVICV